LNTRPNLGFFESQKRGAENRGTRILFPKKKRFDGRKRHFFKTPDARKKEGPVGKLKRKRDREITCQVGKKNKDVIHSMLTGNPSPFPKTEQLGITWLPNSEGGKLKTKLSG